ncbi:hypothetical protein EGJ34_17175 [Stenotrophomonas sp. 278]|nr:hypothetical protein EGJ34_17175 [Stenotrophomonas sp. 278]
MGEGEMAQELKFDSLGTTCYGHDIFVEACQPEGGKAVVCYVEVGERPVVDQPQCGQHESLVDALDAGLRWAIARLTELRAREASYQVA